MYGRVYVRTELYQLALRSLLRVFRTVRLVSRWIGSNVVGLNQSCSVNRLFFSPPDDPPAIYKNTNGPMIYDKL